MARGWESKSVEDQIEESARRKASEALPRPTAAELARNARRQALQLARSRLLEQLARARSEAHRQALRQALADLEHQLGDVTG